jgi:hypothetical protein
MHTVTASSEPLAYAMPFYVDPKRQTLEKMAEKREETLAF